MNLSDMPNELFFQIPCLMACIWAVSRFCQNHLQPGRNSRWTFPLCLFFCQIIPLILHKSGGTAPFSYILLMLQKHLLFLAAVFLLFQASAAKKLLTASVLIAAITLTDNFCESFLSCTALFALHTIWHVKTPILGQKESVLILWICTAMVILVLSRLRVRFDPDILFSDQGRKWHGILAAPLLGITAVIDIANWSASNGILVRSRAGLGIYYDQLLSHGELCVLTALSMFAAGCYLSGMETICMEQQKSSRYHAQIAAYQMLEQQYRQSERLRHDLKNHIIALSGLLERREWEKSRDYLKNMEQSAALGTGEEATGNSAVDALLYQKRMLAEKHGIRWECSVQIPPACCIHEFDLCVLFGNLLDNALKACEKLSSGEDRMICIQAGPVKKCFLLEIKNRTDLKNTDEIRSRRKHPAVGHGIGLMNVQDVLSKYNGTLHLHLQDGLFAASLLLPMTPPSRT